MGQCANPKMLFELQNMYRTQENQEMFTELEVPFTDEETEAVVEIPWSTWF
jgi:hypothetical protein